MTPQQIDAMKQALEALKDLQLCTDDYYDCSHEASKKGDEAITALEEALTEHAMREVQRLGQEIEQESVAWATREDFYRELDRSVNRMRQQMEIKGVVMRYADYDIALPVIDIRDGHVLVGQVTTPPQPERHELQAKGEHPAPCARFCEANAFKIVIKNLKAQLAQPEQEPVAWMDADGNVSDNNDHKCFPIPLYTAPPQRTWVDVPDEEIKRLWIQYRAALPRYLCFAKALLSIAKEKNT